MSNELVPHKADKQNLKEWLESFLPFSLPSIPLVRTAANFDRALARIISAAGDNVIGRIDRSTGIIAATGHATTKAVKSAQNVATQEISDGGPLAQRAVEYAYRDSLFKQQNRENIARLASEELQNNPPQKDADKDIDAEWLANFARFAETASDEAVQSLWAKILAGEIKQPGAFRLRTLQEVSVLSKDDAIFIHRLLTLSINDKFLFIDPDFKEPNFDDILIAEHLGIVTAGGAQLTWATQAEKDKPFHFVCCNMAIEVIPTVNKSVTIPSYPLTIVGNELAKIVSKTDVNTAYLRRLGEHLKRQEIGRVSLVKLSAPNKGGGPSIASRDVL